MLLRLCNEKLVLKTCVIRMHAAQLQEIITDAERLERGGPPLMTVETEAIGTHGVHMKGVLPWLIHWARPAGTGDFCPAFAGLVGPVKNMFFLTVPYFNSF
jgi:hypothetical protein